MSHELIERPELSPVAQPAFTIDDMRAMAETVLSSGMFPQFKTVDQVFTLMMKCQADGLHPLQATARYHFFCGTPTMKAETMLAEFQRAGGKIEWKENSNTRCAAVFHAPGLAAPAEFEFTIQDAERAGLLGKDIWKKYPRPMLRSRLISEGVRSVMPGVVSGIYTDDEIEGFEAKTEVSNMMPQSKSGRSAPAAASRSSAPQQQHAPTGGGTETYVVRNVEHRSGAGKNGKPWTKWGVTLDGPNGTITAGTFSATLGENAQGLRGQSVYVTLEQDGQYWNLLSIEPAEVAAEPGAES